MRSVGQLLFAAGIAAGIACAAEPRSTSTATAHRQLAADAVRQALDNGAFEALTDAAVASSFALARVRLETPDRRLSPNELQQLELALRRVFVETFPRKSWEEALLPVFSENLTEAELHEVLRFQRSPLGRKLMAIQAQAATGGGGIGQALLASRQAEFSARLGEALSAALSPSITR